VFNPFERQVAWRYLRSRRREGFISVIAWFSFGGIALGVAALIIVMSVMNGFREDLMGRILGINGHVAIYSNTGKMLDFDDLNAKVHSLPDVVQAAPIIEGQAMATVQGYATGVLVHGIRAKDLEDRTLISQKIVAGSLSTFSESRSIVIGSKLAEKMSLFVGDTLTLVAPKGTATAFGTMPRSRSYTVSAIFDVGMHEYDLTFVFIPLESAQKFFLYGDSVTGIEIFTKDPAHIDDFKLALAPIIHGKNMRLFDWQQANKPFFNAIQVERNVMFIILTLVIVVAAFNVISSLIMLVKDKGRDIAILRTMGASRRSIMKIFLLTGSTIGVVGAALGAVLGLLFSYNIETIRRFVESLSGAELFSDEIYFLSKLPSKVDPVEAALVIGIALILTFLASLYPSWRASTLDPVEALRYE